MPSLRPLLLLALLTLPAGGLAAQDVTPSECDAIREARALVERQLAETKRRHARTARTHAEVARAMERSRPEVERALVEARRAHERALRDVDAAPLRRELREAVREATRDAHRLRELTERRRANRGTVDI